MLGKRYLTAAKAYERAYALRTSGNLAAQIHEAYLRGGKPEVGESVVLRWLENQPTDTATRMYLADASIRTSRLPTAIAQYELLAQKYPNDQHVLNNLAWAYGENGDSRAVATAEKAFRINEANAAVADTYGWMLFDSGKIAEGTLESVGDDVWTTIKTLWSRMGIAGNKSARQAAEAVAADPTDELAKTALAFQIRQILASHPELSDEVEKILSTTHRASTTVIASGTAQSTASANAPRMRWFMASSFWLLGCLTTASA